MGARSRLYIPSCIIKRLPSCGALQGHRHFLNTPGIYVHNEDNSVLAENYIRFTPLCDDGVFWAAKWEVRVERTRQVEKITGRTNQWIQKEGSVVLAALWLCGRRYEDMKSDTNL